MFDISFWELFIVGIVALLILGPERLPGAIRSTVKTVRSVKNMASGFKTEIEEQLRVHELHENLKKAEKMGLENVSPEIAQSVEELKQAALSVQQPYKKADKDASNTDALDKEPHDKQPHEKESISNIAQETEKKSKDDHTK
jgi:sec-independent protein translocase protein TatB